MGRDKAPKPAPAETKQEQPVIGLDGKPQRPPKGHKQRGAGTVITAKAPIVTTDGIVLKAHERLPSQLLQEYCQREKRPTPKYEHSPPGHRFKVILEDPKNSKNDLNFCPVQNFESDKLARDYAALLALWHFQKSLPLERKLPEPFASTWSQMIAAEKEAQGSSGKGAKVSSSSGKGASAGGGAASSTKISAAGGGSAAASAASEGAPTAANLLLSASKPAAGGATDSSAKAEDISDESSDAANPAFYAKSSGKGTSVKGGKLVVGT